MKTTIQHKAEKIKIGKVLPNPENPRVIRDHKFEKLQNSIKEFPEMLELRPLVVDENMVILGGNMRFEAIKALGHKEAYVIKVEGLTEAQKKEFVIKDNQSFGEWNWDTLANEWDTTELVEWGFEEYEVGMQTPQDYEPELAPETSYDDVTEAEIKKKATELAQQMVAEQKLEAVICPKCGNEFHVG